MPLLSAQASFDCNLKNKIRIIYIDIEDPRQLYYKFPLESLSSEQTPRGLAYLFC